MIEADNAGNISIADHERQYGDPALNPDVSVDGDTLASGAAIGETVRVYYIDALREGGAVAYLFTIDPAPKPVQGGNIHSVGAVTIPAAGTAPGGGVQPPGTAQP